jgi:Chaperone of endosialidase
MGGKTGTTTSSVQIPPEVLARYNAVNAQAQQTAQTPFQQYSTNPNAFVAPLNEQQQAGIGNINQYANAAQPAYGAAMQGTAQAYQGFNPQNYQQGVAGYMNPFINQAMGATAAQLQNVNQQQQQQLLGNTIQQGAFGGDRGNIAQAALMNQQNLALGNTLSNMASQGYQNAAQNYMTGLGQQGALANQMGALGAGAQTAGLAGAQAQLGAGTLGQQTQQAGLTALYNQFQQQQAYPFQTAQFLANIAEGTGALSGSTTTQTSPTSFFSDRRLKHDIHRIGETDEGLPIYKFKYKGDDKTNIGFMADEVEKIHPEAVGESHGFKTVDYDRAARYAGGLVGNSEGGAVSPMHTREGYFEGGDVINPIDLQNILASQKQSYAPFQQGGLYGATSGGTPGGKGYVPAGSLPVAHLAVASPIKEQQGETLMGDVRDASEFSKGAQDLWNQGEKFKKFASNYLNPQSNTPSTSQPQQQYRGGLVHAYADGGDVEPYQTNDAMDDVVKSGEKNPAQLKVMQAQPTSGGAGGSNTLGELASIAAIPGEISTIGSGIGQAASAVLPFFGVPLATGGLVGRRRRFADGGDTDEAPLADLSTIENSAQNAGLNVGDFRKLVQGESGNKFKLGDDNSSAGPFQLHVGNVSQQYPHPGKGDDFFNEMHPDLAQKFTPQQKIAYLNDPANLQETSDWTANHIAKNGAGAWTVARQQGLLGATRPADMSAKNAAIAGADGDQNAQGFQPPEAGAQPKSLGDSLTSESILIPLLSGLGAMAGSNSRYLGAALLQGIGAGANAYENVQNQMLERQALQPVVQQRNIQTANDLTNGWLNYKATSGTDISLADYAKMVGYQGNIPSSGMPGQAPAGNGVPGTYSYSATEYLNPNTMVQRNGVTLNAMNDPLYLQNFIRTNSAATGQAVQNLVKQAQTRLAQIEATGKTTDAQGNSINAPGAIVAGQQSTYAGNKVSQANKFVEQGNDLSASYGTTRQALQDLQDAYSKYRAGSLGTDRSALDRIAQELDPDNKIPALHGLSQDSSSEQYDIAMKSAAQLVARQLQGMSTVAPKSEIGLLNSFAANPDMSPGAIRSIIVRGKALVDYNQALHSNFRPENENFDVQNYINKFNGDHDYSNEFIGKNEKETPWMKGQAPAVVQNENDIARLPSGAPFVVPYGPSKGQIRYAP